MCQSDLFQPVSVLNIDDERGLLKSPEDITGPFAKRARIGQVIGEARARQE